MSIHVDRKGNSMYLYSYYGPSVFVTRRRPGICISGLQTLSMLVRFVYWSPSPLL